MAQLRSKKIWIAATTVVAAAALVGAVHRPSAQAPAPAEGTVIGRRLPHAVKDSYIVTLKKNSGFKAASSPGQGPDHPSTAAR